MSADSDSSGIATPTSEVDAQLKAKQRILSSAITSGLQAVGSALRLPDDQINDIVKIVNTRQEEHVDNLLLEGWLEAARLMAFSSQSQAQVMNVAIALAFLRESGRQDVVVSSTDLDQVWILVKDALQCTSLTWNIMRSAQGFHSIPLWSIVVDGRINELIRLHIWLPDGIRADPDVAMHMHQPFVQSWILAGEGTDQTFDVTPADEGDATHAEYRVGWKDTDDKESDKGYKTHAKSSTITNTGKLVRVQPREPEVHTRNMSYHVPDGVFHKTEVDPDALHATILFFDSSRGFTKDAPVIGPICQKESTHERKPANLSAVDVASIIVDLRNWEVLQETGEWFSGRGEWEEALGSYRTALHICHNNNWLDRPRYKHVSLGTIGKIYRMLGLYSQASKCLEETVFNTPQTRFRVDCAGELATVYRHMDRLDDCKRAAQDQYHGAKQLNLAKFACRAIGSLGMVNYQLYLLNQDVSLLETAISQLNERIERAQDIGDITLESIGYSRLSLCYMAKGDPEMAVQMGQKNFDLMCMQHDETKTGFAKAFFGRALLFAGQKDKALALFNLPYGSPPIVALCSEISSEHRQYITEIIEAGADLKLRDKKDYSALECAVYNGDDETTKIIELGLRAQISNEGGNVEEQLTQFRYEATLRKGYRYIFQDGLRPVLLGAVDSSALRTLRQTYATSLAEDSDRRNTFDGLKYVTYADFLRCGQLPRSDAGYTRESAGIKEGHPNPYILFFSYRWIAKDRNVQTTVFSPDDGDRTQYKRMLSAIEHFLHLHSEVNRDQLCIWVDFACVDQDHQRPGVAALPMNLAQCNAVISLIDDRYYDRSWCCIEVLMIQTLKKAYGIHLWYEHVIDPVNAKEFLRTGPLDLEVNMAEKQVTYEHDRPKLLFLERQTKLLG